ncbi:chromate efflux transporter [Rhizobium sp. YIM 134829]|uniref:chromate efflux transporter n=1 Tax=Rhizobium sp. YIM 134829 TaxID=3390453 RepID=UPI003979E59D
MAAVRDGNEALAPGEADLAVRPTFLEAAKLWATIGILSFGGPAGQIALMHREVVEKRRWIGEARFLHALNYCMLLPGPEAQQLATYIGWLMHGTRGGLVAGLLFVLPGLAVMLALSVLYALYHQTDTLAAIFFGLKAAVLAIVVEALLRLGKRALKGGAARLIAAAAFLSLFLFAVPFPIVILLAGLIGLAGLAGGAGAGVPDLDPAPPGRRAPEILRMTLIWAALWMAPVALAALLDGTIFVAIGIFFAKIAVVTFGGAYAVLSYVAQQAVETHGWLRPGEMLDGLALAETTPGPLVLVLSFVAAMAAFREASGLDPVVAALLGGTLAAWVTFVPCFYLIFLGAPSVERLRGNRRLSAALSAISAAVAGVILNLAVWFALHVLFARVDRSEIGPLSVPVPELSSFEPQALLLAGFAALLLFGLKRGVPLTLLLCGGAGLLLARL